MSEYAERLRPPFVDALLASVLLGAGELELAGHTGHTGLSGPRWADALAIGILMTSLAWRRRLPLVVAAVGSLSISALALRGDVATLNLPMVVLFVTPYSVARYEPRRRAWAGLVLCLGAPLAAALPAPAAGGLVFSLGMVGASWTAGRAIRANSRHAQALRRQAARDDAAREEVQRLALAAERSRIARELQAVVVASVSEMVLAAETACRLVEESPEDADLMMDSVDVAARQVLADVRRVLGILRDPDEPVGLAPLPGIGHLDELRAVDGRGARLLVVGSARPVPASVDLGVFRIAESALASVREHPSDEPLEVGLRYAPGSVEIELSVGGQPCAAWPTPTMREWADVCGARLGSEPHGSEAHGSMERFVVSIPDSSGADR